MTSRALRGALSLCSAGGMLFCASAWAQSPAPGAAQPPAPEPYVDRVLDADPQSLAADATEEDTSGWPRGWSAELQSSQQNAGIKTRNESLLFSGYLDTPDYGALSANLNLNRYTNPTSAVALTNSGGALVATPYSYDNTSTWRIDQRAMPFNGGWFGHNSIGTINLAGTPLARGIGRVALPNLPIEGASATVERPGSTSFNVSGGRLGYFDGIVSQGFSPGRGQAASAGAQTQLTGEASPFALGRTDAAVQVVDVRDYNANGVPGFGQDTRSVWAATSWQGAAPWADTVEPGFGGVSDRVGGLRVQANVVHSAGQPSDAFSFAPRDAASGAWMDASWRTPWLLQGVSAFYFEPSLRWGSDSLPSDLRGVSWRGDISTRQWQLSSNLEFSESVSGRQGSSVFGNVYGRYRFDSRDAISSIVAARSGDFPAQSLQVTWEHQSELGFTQWQNDVAHSRALRLLRSNVDHTWNVGEFYTLSTSLGVEQTTADSVASARAVSWGILGTTPFVMGAKLDLNLRGTEGIGGNSARFLNANARLSWPITAGWSFIAQYSASQGRQALDPTVVSALTAATLNPVIVLPSSRAFLIALRYESRAGSASAPIGGAPGIGAGRLEGSVYFDQDSNGRREANEGGVPGVTVILDRRYVARTDAQGRYYFPAVAAGNHEIELVQDNLPLPWSSPSSGASRRIDVFVRDTVIADFPVQRDR